ncbi:late competence development ComFB family protein [Treponema sp. OMZ 840]|uniref:late competence development ComFB family protein n=1 Tax=Treponema sp. OMZ 840 TaxID=244313 RepID=UPI003D921128
MNIHNILEDRVLIEVNNNYKRVKEMNPAWFTCDCEQCRLDTAAYVLNKLPPRYIVSGRGLTHMLAHTDIQMSIDIDALIIEGMKKVSANLRPFHDSQVPETSEVSKGPVFNFPFFIGSVYDGTTFEPVKGAEISLSRSGSLCTMIDHTWTNPTVLTSHTRGRYTFWVKPEKAQTLNETKQFQFKIEIKAEGFDTVIYTFDIPLTSCEYIIKEPNTVESVKIQDLYLFPTSC